MDFLGLRNLTVIQNALRFIKKNRGLDIYLNKIDYSDKNVLHYIGTGNTEGIFQLESSGMKSFMKELKPESLEDIIAGISLYRPGPMDFIPKYIEGKNNADSVTYDCPQLESILEPTYGCIVYQEQVMQIVRDLAGFSLGRSDLLRRAMSKKKADVMAKERKVFVYGDESENIKGCVNNGISESIANKIYDEMTVFAQYAFNKSHAAAYAVVTYQTAYLKYYYTAEFMAAMLSSVMDMTDKVAEYVYSCRSMGIKILPPDINEGESGFSAKGDSIRYGLTAIKNVGKAVIDNIVAEREARGIYKDLEDFISRTAPLGVNKRAIENFIKAGAFDSFGATRKQMMMVYAQIVDSVNQDKKDTMQGQMSLFDIADEDQKKNYKMQMPNVGEYDNDQKLEFEKEVIGIYASGHPLSDMEEKWKRVITNMSLDFAVPEEGESYKIKDKSRVTVGGIITTVTRKFTKRGNQMAFLTLEDLVGTVEIVVFPREFDKYREILMEGRKIFITGEADIQENAPGKVKASEIKEFVQVPSELWIAFKDKEAYIAGEQKLISLLSENKGNDRVMIALAKERQRKMMPAQYRVDANKNFVEKLKEIYGEDLVKLLQ